MIKMIAPVTAGPDVRLYQHFFDTSCLFLIIFLGFFFANMDMAPCHPTED